MQRAIIVLALAAATAVAGCGGSDNSSKESAATPTATPTQAAASGGGGKTVKVSSPADGSLKFDQATLTAKAGKVTFNFDNPSSVPHALEIEGKGKTKVVTGGSASFTAKLKPGKYEYYCPVDSHKAAGMKGELTVQ